MSLAEAGLSERGSANYEPGRMRTRYAAIYQNPWHAETNTNGFINLGVSENYVMAEEVAKFANEKLQITRLDIDYGEGGPYGKEKLRAVMANHMTEYFNPFEPIRPDNILFATGCTGLCDLIGHTIAEEGDGILMSSPIYQQFERDWGMRAKVKVVYVPFKGVDQFSLDAVACYEKKLLESNASGTKIRGLLICNPHNPLGQCYPPDVLIAYMQLCAKHKIHLIVDEIYAVSHYKIPTLPNHPLPSVQNGELNGDVPQNANQAVPFHSILSFDTAKHIPHTHLHVLYGVSKDFAAGGLRLGCVYTRSQPLLQSLWALMPFSWPSNLSEALAATMLADAPWRHDFLATSQRVLGERAAFARRMLDGLGVPHNGDAAAAGFFLWVDLRRWVAEMGGGREGEKAVRGALQEGGVFWTPGTHLRAEEPGWFRFCFVKSEGEVREGLKRVGKALEKIGGVKGSVEGKRGEELEKGVETLNIAS